MRHTFATGTIGSLPPCGGEVERGVNPLLRARVSPPSLTLPRKGGGDDVARSSINQREQRP
jgi:error-prone DNA polymerase